MSLGRSFILVFIAFCCVCYLQLKIKLYTAFPTELTYLLTEENLHYARIGAL